MLSPVVLELVHLVGAAERSRTSDLRITNALLYQLSYSGRRFVGSRLNRGAKYKGRLASHSVRAVLRQRPRHVLAHQFAWIIGAGRNAAITSRRRRRIAKAHRDVAQPPLVADTPDCRALMPLVELHFVPGKQIDQRG